LTNTAAQVAAPSQKNEQAKKIEDAIRALNFFLGGSTDHGDVDNDYLLKMRSVLSDLAARSLISLTEDHFTIHRLVQDTFRLSIPREKKAFWIQIGLDILKSYLSNTPPSYKSASWNIWKELESHVHMIIAHARAYHIGEPTIALINELGNYFYIQSRYDEAEILLREGLQFSEKTYGSDHRVVSHLLNIFGAVLYEKKKLDEAASVLNRALSISEKIGGVGFSEDTTTLNNLGVVLRDKGSFSEAESLFKHALLIDEKRYGEHHQNIGRTLNNLAQLLSMTHRIQEAEKLYRRAIRIFRNSFGNEHPHLAIALNNLAVVLYKTDKLDEAEILFREAIDIDRKIFGADHVNLAIRYLNLGNFLFNRIGQSAEAKDLCHQALDIFKKKLGDMHPYTKSAQRMVEHFF